MNISVPYSSFKNTPLFNKLSRSTTAFPRDLAAVSSPKISPTLSNGSAHMALIAGLSTSTSGLLGLRSEAHLEVRSKQEEEGSRVLIVGSSICGDRPAPSITEQACHWHRESTLICESHKKYYKINHLKLTYIFIPFTLPYILLLLLYPKPSFHFKMINCCFSDRQPKSNPTLN